MESSELGFGDDNDRANGDMLEDTTVSVDTEFEEKPKAIKRATSNYEYVS
jgi:hypothetical protein